MTDRTPSSSDPRAASESPKVRKPSIQIDAADLDDDGTSAASGSPQHMRTRLKEGLADLHEHAGFDVLQGGVGSSTHEDHDPEAEYMNVRDIRSAKQAVMSTGGQFVLGLVVGLAGIGLAIYAVAQVSGNSTESLIMLGIAVVIAPISTWWAHKKYKQWLQRKTYLYRLLESLGEDVSDLHPRGGKRDLPPNG
ncbi:MAG: hypothetical protein AAGK04_02580 [Planctomycetota bacterium]